MAQAITNDDQAVRESLYNVIANIDPQETQLLSGLGHVSAEAVTDQWLNDTLKTPGPNSRVEGADATYAARTNPTRGSNICQIVAVDVNVSATEDAANKAGMSTRYAYELDKANKEWANDFEYALMRGTIASTSGSAVRTMRGLKASITTVSTSQSGVSLSEDTFNAYLGNAWAQGGKPTEVYVGRVLKRRISGFTAGATKNVDTTDRRLVNAVDVYDSDFGRVKLFLHRFITADADVNYDIVGIEPERFKVAMLRDPKHEPLAKTGDGKKGMVVGEGTLRSLAERSSFIGLRHL